MSVQLPLNVRLKDGSSFDNFYAGRNREVLGRLREICEGLAAGARPTEQVLFIWGPSGSGRTHLLQAACRVVQQAGRMPFYLSLADAATLDPTVLESAEHANLVCLDDVEAVAGRGAWERALFVLFERLRAEGGVLLAAGAGAPGNLGFALPDLSTRLGWGPVYQIEPLDDDGKLAAVRLRARNRGLEMSEEVARYILARYPRDMGSLFDLLERLDRVSLATQRRITVPFLKEMEKGKVNSE